MSYAAWEGQKPRSLHIASYQQLRDLPAEGRAQSKLRTLGSQFILSFRRYLAKPEGVSKLCAYVVLRDKVLKPMMAGAGHPKLSPLPDNPHQLDISYTKLHLELIETFKLLGLVA